MFRNFEKELLSVAKRNGRLRDPSAPPEYIMKDGFEVSDLYSLCNRMLQHIEKLEEKYK